MNIPKIGLGTWDLRGRECTRTVEIALELGYQHVDTAHVYDNHSAIAKAIKEWNREELFITSKLALEQVDDRNIEKSIQKACEKALKELKTDYLDLYLIHWPDRSRPMEEMLKAMHGLKEMQKVRSVGVSNYTIHHMQDALDAGLKIVANQVEFHPYLYQRDLLDFCMRHGIQLISYRPFGKGKLLKAESLFGEIGKKYGKTAGQVVLRWIIQKDVPVIPKASSEEHLRENLSIFDFSLDAEDMQRIDRLNKNIRYCDGENAEFDY